MAYNLGIRYLKGSGVKKDTKQALHHFQLAAVQTHPNACYQLGKCYEKGLGIEKDAHQAARYYRLALLQGHKKAKRQQQNLLKQQPDLENTVSTLTVAGYLATFERQSPKLTDRVLQSICLLLLVSVYL